MYCKFHGQSNPTVEVRRRVFAFPSSAGLIPSPTYYSLSLAGGFTTIMTSKPKGRNKESSLNFCFIIYAYFFSKYPSQLKMNIRHLNFKTQLQGHKQQSRNTNLRKGK